jgi:predicted phosphohydrolase
MKIQYCSDLHLEFPENNRFIKNNPLVNRGDILILAGDILPFNYLKSHNSFIDFVSDYFHQVYWVPGNHEYYGYNIGEEGQTIQEKIKENVFLVNNVTVQLVEVELIFSTLWSKISQEKEEYIEARLSDFFRIALNNRKLTHRDYNDLHHQCRQFIEEATDKKPSKKRVIVTHHVPTLHFYPEKYIGSDLNEAFAVELFDLIEEAKADFWIYGHHHCNVQPFKIGTTQLLTNQLGYVQHDENLHFNREAVIEI